MASSVLDRAAYGELLRVAQPRIPHNEAEHTEMLAAIEQLMLRGESLSQEESALLELLAAVVEHYEEERYRIDEAPPAAVLRALMEEHGMKQSALAELVGSKGLTSDILHGRRQISKTLAKRLGERFGISPAVFL